MKNNAKLKVITILIFVAIIFTNNISYGADMASYPQIKTRGLVFNTGILSDQNRLIKDFFRASNYSNVPWGYEYDARTKELVRQYQKSKGLGADGIAGKSTIDAINKDILEKKLDIGLRIPHVGVKGEVILVNKSSNTLYFIKDGKIIESYPVATGKTIYLTPNGKFYIAVKFKNPGWGGAGISAPIKGGAPNNPLGTRWIGISYKGGNRYGVHGNAAPKSIGTYASLGCVRMFNKDVENLYEKVRLNTPIWIGPEYVLESYGVEFKHNNVPRAKVPKPMNINILLNGGQLRLDNPVLNKEGTTYYPFREILEFIGAEVAWDNENKKARGSLNGKFVEFQLNSTKYTNSEGNKFLPKDKEAFIVEGKMYLPIRNLMESLGYDVLWEPATNTISLDENIYQETNRPHTDLESAGVGELPPNSETKEETH